MVFLPVLLCSLAAWADPGVTRLGNAAGALPVEGQQLHRIKTGPDWVDWNDEKDILPGSALDLSTQGFCDAPAGRYGWLRNVGGRFEFERRPVSPVRFAGVNLCGTMNFPSHAEADRLVRRLKALGYNSIRLHHYDAGLVEGSKDGQTFNPGRLDRLDYLVAKAIENGLYVTTDLYVSRHVTWRQMGIDRDGSPKDVPGGNWLFKLLIAFHEGAYANWRTFATNFLGHVNPYTGRRYADEPGMPLLSMVNEASYRMGWRALCAEPSFRAAWDAWAAAKRRDDPGFAAGADLSDPAKFSWNKLGRLGDTAPAAFLADHEARNFTRQLGDLRALGAKQLFTSVNQLPYYAPDQAMRRELYGYFDDHLYVDHPRFPRRAWKLPIAIDNLNPVSDPACRLDKHAFMKVEGIPCTLSEFNFCGPNAYRGMNGLLTGAFMAGQDVSGYWRFAYAHAVTNMYDHVGRPGSFDVSADPLNCAAERLAHFLFLRGDFEPFARTVTLELPDARTATREAKMSQMFPEWRRDVAWKARTSCCVRAADMRKGADRFGFLETVGAASAPLELPDAPALRIDRTSGTVRVVTPRTCGVSAEKGRFVAGALDVEVLRGGPMTTLGVSSLDGKPIGQSARLLVTHLTDVQSAGAAYADASCTLKLTAGSERKLVRDGTVRVRLALDEPTSYAVHGLDATGRRTGRVGARVEGGTLVFTAAIRGEKGARICYEVVREPKPYKTGSDVLRMPDGSRISSAEAWQTKAKPQILDFFEKNVYGPLPPRPAKLAFEPVESSDDALDGLARRRQFRVVSTDALGSWAFDVLLYTPKAADGPVPVFVCPNFSGNHSLSADPGVLRPRGRVYLGKMGSEAGRGMRPERIPVKDIVAKGFAVATFCHCDLYVDYGVNHPAPDESVWTIFPPAKRGPALALTAWAWGNMRTLDLLETLPEVDAARVAVVGQSRLAKVAVITAAYDPRFKLCCPNDGGCKTLALVPNLMFPHWFAPGLRTWTEIGKSGLSSAETAKLRGEKPPLPFDQCSLIGCIAPRALHLGASSADVYAPVDVHFAAVKDAEPVWRLFGGTKFPSADRMLDAEPFFGDISWHCKSGPHSITAVDWAVYLEHASRLFMKGAE